MIGELVEGEECKVRTIGVCDHGVIAENFTYDLAHTPSETVMRQGACSHVAGVSGMFPKDVWLKQMKMEGYAGTPLRDSQGRVIGVMVALYTRPLANAKFAEIILQLFSTRTAAEIERKRAEEALRQSEERFRVAIRNSPITVFNLDRDLRYTWMYNPQLPGRMSDHLGRTQGEFYSPEDAERITEIRRRVLETGVGTRHETQIVDSGRTHYFDTTIEPVLDAAGKVIGITGAATDVTALREATEALREAKRKLTEEKLYLEQEIHTELGFAEIIGQSKALQAVMEQVGKVAGSDATVLLLGETGTGKELVARAIHRLSQRANNSFIKMNCAAIPSGLLESELFGNEKGAFTGAVSKKIGRIELADKGTLFLDEIGEISLALQPKLLRVLQDQEFERLGGTRTLKVDFRLIAATNRNLAQVVQQNEFRSDLYYRLNVFPIRVPPLRERRDDIRLLVEHFVQKCARRMNKSITSIPKRTMDALMGWEWPGNVRELENFIERSVILTQGSVLVSPLSELKPISTTAEEKAVDESLEAAEREHILRALRESHGQIGGLKGAAMRLGLKRTTLQSKLKHFGIDPRSKPPEQ
jgi:PAS domain S-box-containing protein